LIVPLRLRLLKISKERLALHRLVVIVRLLLGLERSLKFPHVHRQKKGVAHTAAVALLLLPVEGLLAVLVIPLLVGHVVARLLAIRKWIVHTAGHIAVPLLVGSGAGCKVVAVLLALLVGTGTGCKALLAVLLALPAVVALTAVLLP